MATSLSLWPSAQQKADDGGGGEGGATPEAQLSPTEAPAGKAKGRKGYGAKAVAPKRPPQRGLGVAQLERLRVQERWKKITELDPDPARRNFQPLHFHPLPAAAKGHENLVHHQLAPVPASAVYGAPVAFAGGHPVDCYLHRYRPIVQAPVAFGGAAAAASAVRSLLSEPCFQARFRVGSPFPEPPSSQIPQCFPDQCEFCARKKRLFGNDVGYNVTNGADYFEMDLAATMAVNLGCGCHQRKGKPANERELAIKEFEFFPSSSRSASFGGGSSDIADRKAGDASSSSSVAVTSTPLDLSLKLSL